jgi:hypothetical protein
LSSRALLLAIRPIPGESGENSPDAVLLLLRVLYAVMFGIFLDVDGVIISAFIIVELLVFAWSFDEVDCIGVRCGGNFERNFISLIK